MSGLSRYLSLNSDQRMIEHWITRICDELTAYEIESRIDLTKYIVRLGYLSDFELYNPRLMYCLFRDIEMAIEQSYSK